MRSYCYWRLREALDPTNEVQVALPPCEELKADLTTLHYKIKAGGLYIESKDDVRKRLGRSTDKGDSVALTYAPGGPSVFRRKSGKPLAVDTSHII